MKNHTKKLLFLAIPLAVPLTFARPVFAQVAPAQTGPIEAPQTTKPAALMSEKEVRDLGEGPAFPFQYLDIVLGQAVDKDGNISYAKWKNNNDLDTFLRAVAVADLSKFPAFKVPADPAIKDSKETLDRSYELTFWINAYNALFLKAVADAYPVSSIGEIKDFDKAKTRLVAGKNYSFAEMRAKIDDFDSRALFALNSGLRGGPSAPPAPLGFFNLERQLDALVSVYVNNIARVNAPSRDENSVKVSDWLKSVDAGFKPAAAHREWDGIRYILKTYTTRDSDQHYFIAGDYQVLFFKADGKLNDRIG